MQPEFYMGWWLSQMLEWVWCLMRTKSMHACYSRFRVSSPVCPLHAAVTHVIKVLESRSSREFQWQLARESSTLITWVIAVFNGQTGLETLKRDCSRGEQFTTSATKFCYLMCAIIDYHMSGSLNSPGELLAKSYFVAPSKERKIYKI